MSYTVRERCTHCGRSFAYTSATPTAGRHCLACDVKPRASRPVKRPYARGVKAATL